MLKCSFFMSKLAACRMSQRVGRCGGDKARASRVQAEVLADDSLHNLIGIYNPLDRWLGTYKMKNGPKQKKVGLRFLGKLFKAPWKVVAILHRLQEGSNEKKITLSDLFLVTTFNPLKLSQTISCQMLFKVIKLEIVKWQTLVCLRKKN